MEDQLDGSTEITSSKSTWESFSTTLPKSTPPTGGSNSKKASHATPVRGLVNLTAVMCYLNTVLQLCSSINPQVVAHFVGRSRLRCQQSKVEF
jgi:hypothetical protein